MKSLRGGNPLGTFEQSGTIPSSRINTEEKSLHSDYVHGNRNDKVNIQILDDNYFAKKRFCPNYWMDCTDFHRLTRSSLQKWSN
ncbi:hypothetical protein Y032_0134g1874 [Ancylostoma ceylanicum]|nr:hypothetical protein Y032_0134g1874 [Ancylostoma ceylanicum]